MVNEMKKSVQSKIIPTVTINLDFNGWWLTNENGTTNSPMELISDEYQRKLVMAEANDLCWPLPSGLNVATVRYKKKNGNIDSYRTDINGSRLEVTKYFLNRAINIGSVDDDLVFVVDVQVQPSNLKK
jgi:hypothetical protein